MLGGVYGIDRYDLSVPLVYVLKAVETLLLRGLRRQTVGRPQWLSYEVKSLMSLVVGSISLIATDPSWCQQIIDMKRSKRKNKKIASDLPLRNDLRLFLFDFVGENVTIDVAN